MLSRNRGSFDAFTVRYTSISNRITTPVHVWAAFDPIQTPTTPELYAETVALWDTGATASMITRDTAEKLDLVATGSTLIHHAAGVGQANTYIVNIGLPNRVMVVGVSAVECAEANGQFGLIVGMDIISRGDLAITNLNNATWVSFRIPSMQQMDYVLEWNQLKYAGTPRNAPCPCGAKDVRGRPIKYKFCHGRSTIP